METSTKEVYFNVYCEKCAYKDKKETEDPCDECLSVPVNSNSHKPIRWEEKE